MKTKENLLLKVQNEKYIWQIMSGQFTFFCNSQKSKILKVNKQRANSFPERNLENEETWNSTKLLIINEVHPLNLDGEKYLKKFVTVIVYEQKKSVDRLNYWCHYILCNKYEMPFWMQINIKLLSIFLYSTLIVVPLFGHRNVPETLRRITSWDK